MLLVTGPTGHIGNVLVRELVERGKKVRALVLPQDDLTPLMGLDVELVLGDVLHPHTLARAFTGVEEVYHLAGMISIMPKRDDLVHRVNVEGTKNVLAAAKEAGIRRMLYTSSIHALKRMPDGITIDESVPFDPEGVPGHYDQSKAEASLAVLEAARQGMDTVIVCPTGVTGPYDYKRSEIGQIILDCIEEKLQFYVDGAYDFVDVRDVAQGMILAQDKGRSGETYILSGERITVKGLVETLWELTGKRFMQMKVPNALASFAANFTPSYYRLMRKKPRITPYSIETLASNSVITHEKASRELGYQPRLLKESLADAVQWFLENKRLVSSASKG
jgi:dihydroflavonol-4-reductase